MISLLDSPGVPKLSTLVGILHTRLRGSATALKEARA